MIRGHWEGGYEDYSSMINSACTMIIVIFLARSTKSMVLRAWIRRGAMFPLELFGSNMTNFMLNKSNRKRDPLPLCDP